MKTTHKPSPSLSDSPPSTQPPASPFPSEFPTSPATSLEARLSSPTSGPATDSSPTRLLDAKDLSPHPNSATSPPPPRTLGATSQPLPQEYPAHSPRPTQRALKLPQIPGRFLGLLIGMGAVGVIGYIGVLPAWTVSKSTDRPLVSAAKRASLTITVSERGNVESQVTVDGICEL